MKKGTILIKIISIICISLILPACSLIKPDKEMRPTEHYLYAKYDNLFTFDHYGPNDKENTYYFIMPAANVEVSVVYIESIKVETKDSSEGDKDVDNVMVNIAPSDEEPIIENGVLVIPVTINSITVPAPTDPSATDNKDVTVYIAGEVLSSDGQETDNNVYGSNY